MKNKIIIICSLALVPLFFTLEVQATIYKCVNVNAEVYYNDKPCPVSDIERQLKSVKDPEGGYIPPDFVSDSELTGSKGAVVGSTSERSVNKTEKESSDSSSKGSNNSGSVSSSQSSSASKQDGSNSTSQTKTNNNSAANNGNSNQSIKNIIHKERDYKEGS